MHTKPYRFDRNELAGSLGDLGTLVPLLVGLVAVCGIRAGPAILVVGVTYLISGLYYRIPIPVQPLKAMAAIAIAVQARPEVIAAGALLMAAILFLLAATNLIRAISKLFSIPVIRGIQLGLGLILIRRALIMIFGPAHTLNGDNFILQIGRMHIPASLIVAIIGFVFLFFFISNKRLPATILIILFGIIIGFVFEPAALKKLNVGLLAPETRLPLLNNMQYAMLLLVIPQLPLTIGNAVIATANTAEKYFNREAQRVTIRALPLTMAAGNFLASIGGGMPVCHGSGGLTAHYKCGARSGGSNIIIGTVCIIGAIFFEQSFITVFGVFPMALLGVLLFYVGLHHALLVRDLKHKFDFFIAFLIAAVALAAGNLSIGFAAGIAATAVANLTKRLRPVSASPAPSAGNLPALPENSARI